MYDDLVVASYGQVIQSVMDDDTYMEVAKADFASVADSWICAHALSKGYVIVNDKFETKIEGLFAIGDCIQKEVRQIATAVGDAANAIHFLEK